MYLRVSAYQNEKRYRYINLRLLLVNESITRGINHLPRDVCQVLPVSILLNGVSNVLTIN